MSTSAVGEAHEIKKPVSLSELFAVYFRMGFTAFGPAMMAETKKNIVKKKRWISEGEFLNGLALGQLIPGATFVSLTVYIGYKLRGIAGAATSFLGFLLPPTAIMVLLSYLYFAFGELPLVQALFKGVVAIVVALVANAVLEVGKSAITDIKGVVISLIALGVTIRYPNIFVVLALAAAAGLLLFYPSLKKQEGLVPESKPQEFAGGHKSNHLKEALVLAAAIALMAYGASLQPVLLKLGWVFFRMGALVFGNGFTMSITAVFYRLMNKP